MTHRHDREGLAAQRGHGAGPWPGRVNHQVRRDGAPVGAHAPDRAADDAQSGHGGVCREGDSTGSYCGGRYRDP
jgi:hypothetical protein